MAPYTDEEKRKKAAEILRHIEQITPREKNELFSMGDEGFAVLFAEMAKILLRADRMLLASKRQVGDESGNGLPDERNSDSKKFREMSGLYTGRYYAIYDLVKEMTGPQYTERFFTLLNELKEVETRDPIVYLLAVSGEGLQKEDLLYGIVMKYLVLHRKKKDLTWPDTMLGNESEIYLEHSNDCRVFELLFSSLENEQAPARIRTIALCRLPFMGDKRGIATVRHLRENEKRTLPSLY
jgi:hypothetical protein